MKELQLFKSSNNRIKVLDEKIGILTTPRTVIMSNNCIEKIHDNIGRLLNMTHLDLSHNNIVDLPLGIGQCSQLTCLDLSYNYLELLPLTLIKNTKLSILNLSYNKLKECSGKVITMFIHLKKLELQYNQLDSITVLLYTLKHLEYLDLSHNSIVKIDDNIGNFLNLTYCNLSYNQINFLPGTISNCKELKILELQHNLLEDLPFSISGLKQLVKITINNNNLKTSPICLKLLPQLLSWNLSWNLHILGEENSWVSKLNTYNEDSEMASLTVLKRHLTRAQESIEKRIERNDMNYKAPVLFRKKNYDEDNKDEDEDLFSVLSMEEKKANSNTIPKKPKDPAKGKKKVNIQQVIRWHHKLHDYYYSYSKLIPEHYSIDVKRKREQQLAVIKSKITVVTDDDSLHKSGHSAVSSLFSILGKNQRNAVNDKTVSFDNNSAHDTGANDRNSYHESYRSVHSSRRGSEKSSYRPQGSRVKWGITTSVTIPNSRDNNISYDDAAEISEANYKLLRDISDIEIDRSSLFQTEINSIMTGNNNLANLSASYSDDGFAERVISELELVAMKTKQSMRCAAELKSLLATVNRNCSKVQPLEPFITNEIILPDMKIIESFDLGIDYQEPIELFLRIAHEISVTIIINEYRDTQANLEVYGDDLDDDHFTDYRTISDDNSFKRMSSMRRNNSMYTKTNDASSIDASSVGHISRLTSRTKLMKSNTFTRQGTSRSLFSRANSSLNNANSGYRSDMARILSQSRATRSSHALISIAFGGVDDNSFKTSLSTSNNTKNSGGFNKKALIDFKKIPFIMNYTRLSREGSHAQELIRILLQCYLGIGKSLVKRSECFRDAIRAIEQRGNVKMSCLDIAQRRGKAQGNEDYLDLVTDLYEELLKRIKLRETLAKKKSLFNKSGKQDRVSALLETINNDNIGEQLDNAADDDDGTNTVGTDDNNSTVSTNADTAISRPNSRVESRPISQKGSKPGSAATNGTSNSRPNTKQGDRKSSKASIFDKTELKLSDKLPKIDDDMEIIDPIPSAAALACIKYLKDHRLLTLTYAIKSLSSAVELLDLLGWNPNSTGYEPHTTNTAHSPDWLRESGLKIFYWRGLCHQYLSLYSYAINDYCAYQKLTKNISERRVKVSMIKTFLAQGEYCYARKVLLEMILLLLPIDYANIDNPDPIDIIEHDYELTMLYLLATEGMTQLSNCGIYSPKNYIVYNMTENCLLRANTHVSEEVKNGRQLNEDLIAQQKQNDERIKINEYNMELERQEVQDRITIAKNIARAKLDEPLDFNIKRNLLSKKKKK